MGIVRCGGLSYAFMHLQMADRCNRFLGREALRKRETGISRSPSYPPKLAKGKEREKEREKPKKQNKRGIDQIRKASTKHERAAVIHGSNYLTGYQV